jgi:ATP-dependent DNA ligase
MMSGSVRPDLRFVAFDVRVLAGVDLRRLPWTERRERLELLAQAFNVPIELSPVVEPSRALAEDMADGRLEGIVLTDRTSPYRDGSRALVMEGQGPRWYEREAWPFDKR